MTKDIKLDLLWGNNYVLVRLEAEEMKTPEEKIINHEESSFFEKMIKNIYLEQGIDTLINYFFMKLKFRKIEEADIILEFCKKINKPKIPKKSENRLIRETQMGNNYTLRLGNIFFGPDKFSRMVRAR